MSGEAAAARSPRVFLTGASAGIGRATAELLVARGYEVWGAARSLERLPALPRFHPVLMDVGDAASVSKGFAAAEQESGGGFDVLVNNAGSGAFGPFESLPLEMVRAQLAVLFLGPAQLVQLALPAMRKRGAGVIVNVTSLAARLPIPFMAPYNAAKAALAALSVSLNLELAGSGVSVVDLQPGDIRTGFNTSMWRALGGDYEALVARAWETSERCMASAPPPELVAQAILRLLEAPRPRAVAGDIFQSRVAPLLARLAPTRWLGWGIRRYFGLPRRS